MRRASSLPRLAKVSSKHQLTLPKWWMDHHGVRPGDKVAVWTDGRSLFVKPCRTGEFARLHKAKGQTIIARVRRQRQQEVQTDA